MKSNDELNKELKVIKAQIAVLEEAEAKKKKAEDTTKLIQSIVLAISKTEDLESALLVAIRNICDFSNWSLGQAWLPPKGEEDYFQCSVWYSSSDKYEKFRKKSQSISAGKGYLRNVLTNKVPVWYREEDIYDEEKFQRASVSKELGLKAALQIPIVDSDEVIAIIEFFMTEDNEEDRRIMAIVSAVAAQVGSIIKRKHAEEQIIKSERLLRKQNYVLEKLARSNILKGGDHTLAIKEITEATAKTLDVERVSVWLFDDKSEKITCIDLFDSEGHSEGSEIYACDYPTYFRAIEEERVIDASDAHNDSRTKEFSENYLTENEIKSMLDAPILVNGKLIGVVCSESIQSFRKWTIEEINFAGSIADALSLVLESEELELTKSALGESKENFESLVNSIGGIVWEVDLSTRRPSFISDQIVDILGFKVEEWRNSEHFWRDHLHPEDKKWVLDYVEYSNKQGKDYDFEYRMVSKSGNIVWLRNIVKVISFDGIPKKLSGVSVDITKRKSNEVITKGQNDVLELIALGKPISQILDSITRYIEGALSGALCSILILDKCGERLLKGAAPSLPNAYNSRIEGIKIGNNVGSCGTAAYLKKTVIVSDIENDHLWKDYKSVASNYGLKSCWSIPIFSSENKVLGTFAIYYKEVKFPNTYDYKLIEVGSHLAGIALERNNENESLKDKVSERTKELVRLNKLLEKEIEIRKEAEKNKSHLASIVEHAVDGIITVDFKGNVTSWNNGAEQIYGYTEQEMLNNQVSILIPREKEGELGDIINKIKKGEILERYETVRLRKNKSMAYISADVSPVRDSQQSIIGLSAIVRDVTESKKNEKLAKERLKKIQELERHQKEMSEIELLINKKSTDPLDKLFSFVSLKESFPKDFESIVDRYKELIKLNLLSNENNFDTSISEELCSLGKKLGLLKATAKDVLDIHSSALKSLSKSISSSNCTDISNVGRCMAFELMSYLTGYYQKKSAGK